MNRILIIDDDRELCEILKKRIGQEGREAEFRTRGMEGLSLLREKEFSLVILDVMMPELNGFETLRRIREESKIPILMLTAKNDSENKVRGLKAGADDYLTKPFDMEELLARAEALIRRYTRFNCGEETRRIVYDGLEIDLDLRTVETEKGRFELPLKEFEVLLFLARNQGRILTKQMIYESVWKEAYIYDDSNIMAIVSRLRKKIEPDGRGPKYIQTVKGIGYRFNREV